MKTVNRVVEVDILRGFALFGVLLVNLTMMDSTIYGRVIEGLALSDKIAYWSIRLLAQGKFYTIFAFLFGLGFYFFSKGPIRYGKRLRILFFIGVIHAVLIWYGDILHLYAVSGFFMLMNRKKADKVILRKVGILFGYTVLMTVLLSGGSNLTYHEARVYGETIYQSGTYLELLEYRLTEELPLVIMNLIFTAPKVLILFYIGVLAGRRRWIQNIIENGLLLKRLLILSALLFALTILGVLVGVYYELPVVESLSEEMSTYAGSLFYGLGVIGLSKRKVLNWLSSVGRLALTNYLIQTLFWTFVIGNYGFSKFGEIPYAWYLPLATGFYLVQVLLSNIWLKYYTNGPLEALWRKLY